MKTIQTKYGYSVECFGICNEYATIDCVFDDEMFDGTSSDSYNNWQDAVDSIAEFAHRKGTVLIELCSDD